MTQQEMMDALGNVKQEHIMIGLDMKKNRRRIRWGRSVSIAAVLAVAICIAAIWQGVNSRPSDEVFHLFAIAAQAADGSQTNYELNRVYFNAGTFFENSLFNVDMPLFEFALDTTHWTDDPLTMRQYYSNFDVAVSYTGQETDSEEHIAIFHLFDTEILTNNVTTGYGITGWFEEPTDLEIRITETETGTLVEKITLHICYLPERKGYELTVKEHLTLRNFQD